SLSSSEPRSRKASIGEGGAYVPDASSFRRPLTVEDRERTPEVAAVRRPWTRDGYSEAEGPGASTRASDSDRKERPYSMVIASETNQSQEQRDGIYGINNLSGRPVLLQHRRSSSLPQLTSRQYSPAQTSFLSTAREGASRAASQQAPGGHARKDDDSAAVTSMYDGVIEREAGIQKMDEDEAAGQSGNIAQEQEMRNLDDGLKSLAEASNGHPSFKEQASTTTEKGDLYDDGTRLLVRENVDVQGSSMIPSDSTRTQGFSDENATLDDRETSASNQDFGKNGFIGQESDRDTSIPKNDIGDATAYPDYDHFDGASTVARVFNSQSNGFMPTSPPGAVENASVAAPNTSLSFAQAKVPKKVSDIRKPLPPVSTGVERAAVQRMAAAGAGGIISSVNGSVCCVSQESRRTAIQPSSKTQARPLANVGPYLGGFRNADSAPEAYNGKVSWPATGSPPEHRDDARFCRLYSIHGPGGAAWNQSKRWSSLATCLAR
ncbi:MAG: hypothetical protein Q9193_006719, partial [Seirophora villosa]